MLRNNVLEMLTGSAAHIGFNKAVEDFPADRAGERFEPLEHSMWMLAEHLRIVNRDLIDWVSADEYIKKPYPSGYWPSPDPPSPRAWEDTVSAVISDLQLMRGWAEDSDFDITEPLKRQKSHSALREILLAVAHNGYHIGQMVDLRALLGVPVKDI